MAVSQEVSQSLGHSNINTTKSIYAPYVEPLNHGYIHAIEDQLGPLYVKAANLGVLVEEPPMETTAQTALTFVGWIIAGVVLAVVPLVVLVSRRRRLV